VRPALRVGTRGSALARWQTDRVRERLERAGYVTERIEIRTTGDEVQHVPLSQIGSRALFTRQIDDAMLEGRIDLAVHSLKDLPTTLPAGIALVAVAEREDPRDALVGRGPLTWDDVRHGAVLATSSLRRRAQLLHLRPDLVVRDVRGNVDTRLAKLQANAEWTGILLAVAGLVRLGLGDRIGERLPPELMLPAPGQGALAVTARAGDAPRPRHRCIIRRRPSRSRPSGRFCGRSREDVRCRWRRSRSGARAASCGCRGG
jgi:hydroxymethylbilane synthase